MINPKYLEHPHPWNCIFCLKKIPIQISQKDQDKITEHLKLHNDKIPKTKGREREIGEN